jgi:hypothetical protein
MLARAPSCAWPYNLQRLYGQLVLICPQFETPFYNISLSLHIRSRGGKRETQKEELKPSVIICHEEQKAMKFEVAYKTG